MALRRTARGAWSAAALVATLVTLVAVPTAPVARSQTSYPPLADVPSFDSRRSFFTDQETAVDLAVADLDNEAPPETIVLSADGRLRIFRGMDTTAILDDDALVAAGGGAAGNATSIAAGQFITTTNTLELVVGASNGQSALISLRQKAEAAAEFEFARPPQSLDVDGQIDTVAAADLDGDGQDELILGGADGLQRFEVANGQDGTLSVTEAGSRSTPANVVALAVAQLDADPRDDLVAVSSNEGDQNNGLIIFGEDGFNNDSFGGGVPLENTDQALSVAAASGGQDGETGLVVVGRQLGDDQGNLRAFAITQTNTLTALTIAGPESAEMRSVAAADFNGDGKPDVLAASGGQIDFFTRGITTTLEAGTAVDSSTADKLVVADLTGDGRREVSALEGGQVSRFDLPTTFEFDRLDPCLPGVAVSKLHVLQPRWPPGLRHELQLCPYSILFPFLQVPRLRAKHRACATPPAKPQRRSLWGQHPNRFARSEQRLHHSYDANHRQPRSSGRGATRQSWRPRPCRRTREPHRGMDS